MKFKKKCGFTLAEILITLSIIGVVAVLTISPVITSYKEKATVVKLKKFYVEINNAFQLAEIKSGKIQYWIKGATDELDRSTKVMEKILPYLKISRYCAKESGCFPTIPYSTLNTKDFSNEFDREDAYEKVRLANGISMALRTDSRECTRIIGVSKTLQSVCGSVFVDVNGDDKPNELGVDMFAFYITKYGIIPRGTKDNTDNTYGSLSTCTTGNGRGCAAWVIEKGNQDYLRRTVSWDE